MYFFFYKKNFSGEKHTLFWQKPFLGFSPKTREKLK
jgi:hypothetical protein